YTSQWAFTRPVAVAAYADGTSYSRLYVANSTSVSIYIPTYTPTPTPTGSPTYTPTGTATPTPTFTPTGTLTPTVTSTFTPTTLIPVISFSQGAVIFSNISNLAVDSSAKEVYVSDQGPSQPN